MADHILDGNLLELRMSVSQLDCEIHHLPINDAIDRIADNDLIVNALNDNDSPEVNLVRTCMKYTICVWPYLISLTDHISELKSPHFAVIAALIALEKSGRSEWKSLPLTKSYAEDPEDSFVNS